MNELLSVNEAAPRIGLRPHSLRELCKKGLIRHMKVGPNGGLYRFREVWLEEYLESCTYGPKEKKERKPPRERRQPPDRSPLKQESLSERMARIKREEREGSLSGPK